MNVRPICLLIGALGGQGGGVLTDWLVEAARLEGYPAQATSIPGVAQRTGATTYYFELFPIAHPLEEPVFCLFPSIGDVDLVAALEPTEAGRALENGYVTANTVVVTSTKRQYSTAEKSIAGNGIIDPEAILASLKRIARQVVTINPDTIPDAMLNAMMFGAIIATAIFPISEESARQAIEEKGLAVSANLAGFEAGLQAARQPAQAPSPRLLKYNPPPEGFETALVSFPPQIRPILGHAVARLTEYQNRGYAQLYLQRMQSIAQAEEQLYSTTYDFQLSQETARRLAAWMSYEDVFRVAQLKTRPERFAQIRSELGARENEPVSVVDYLSPGRNELISVLPAAITRLFLGKNHHNVPARSLHMAWPTSNPFGFAGLKLLAVLKPLRPYTLTYAHEQQAIENWLQAIELAIPVDYEIALLAAEAAVWARGYGQVRARGLRCLEILFENWAERLEQEAGSVKSSLMNSIEKARKEPDAMCR